MLAGLAGLVVAASFTRPFTWAADLLTAAVIVAAAALAVTLALGKAGTPGGVARRAGTRAPGRGWRLLAPVGATVAAVGWELYCYTGRPRSAYPTFSSLLDAVDSSRPGRAAAFALWLALGWFLVRP